MMWSCRNSRNCIMTLWLEHVDVAIAAGVVVHCRLVLGSFMLGAAMCGVPEPFGTCSGTCAITVRRLAALRVVASQPCTLPCHMMVDVVICYAAVCSLCCVVPAVLHVGDAAAHRSVCCLSTIQPTTAGRCRPAHCGVTTKNTTEIQRSLIVVYYIKNASQALPCRRW